MELKTARQREAPLSEDKEERDVVSPWDVPLEIRRILGLGSRAKEQVRRWDQCGKFVPLVVPLK